MNKDIRLVYNYFLHGKWKIKICNGIFEEEKIGFIRNSFRLNSLNSLGRFIFNYAVNKIEVNK